MKGECLLFRLPLELRQQIYAAIFGPRRHVELHKDGLHDCEILIGSGPEDQFYESESRWWKKKKIR